MKLVILDGNSVLNRAFYGIKPLTNSQGLHTNGIYGFLNILFKYIDDEKPDYICIAFDLKAPTFRHDMFDKYKAQRKGMPEELAEQVPVLKEVIDALKIPRLELSGYEADDIIGTMSEKCQKQSVECVIATADRDCLQLISNGITVKLSAPKAGTYESVIYDENAVFEKYGVAPKQLIDVKGLMGDASDNIPGVSGVGEKTAYDLIQKYGSLDKIYENIDTLEIKENLKEKLKTDKEMAFLSKKLATIFKDVPLEINFEGLKQGTPDNAKLYELFTVLNFNSFISRFNVIPSIETEKDNFSVLKADNLKFISDQLKKDKKMYFLSENGSIQQFYILSNDNVYDVKYDSFTDNEYYDFLKEMFEDPEIEKYSHDIKPLALGLLKKNIEFNGLKFDTKLAGYVLNPSQAAYELPVMAKEFAGKMLNSLPSICAELPKITQGMADKIQENSQDMLFYDIEQPLCIVLANMEYHGFKVDKDALTDFGKELDDNLLIITEKIYELSGRKFNINSPSQLAEILFNVLGLPVITKTKTGYSTAYEVLEKLRGYHDIIDFLMDYRQLMKLKTTYVDGLLKVINPEDGRIHTSFNQTVTQTGRISSTEPNLQNIPVRNDIGRNLRKMFVSQNDDYCLIDADYSQIELRVLAHIADDENMINAFSDGVDIHLKTASEVFNVPIEEVTSLMRSRAKAVNFGIVYGISDFSLASDIKVSKKDARKYIDEYLETYTGVRDYMHNIVIEAMKNGYVTTLFGRRRYIPELFTGNKMTKNFGTRIALNSPIQGTAADIIKIAMNKVYKRLKEGGYKSRLILQVHDELIVEALKSEADEVAKILKDEMENAAELRVPLLVDTHQGMSWYTAKG